MRKKLICLVLSAMVITQLGVTSVKADELADIAGRKVFETNINAKAFTGQDIVNEAKRHLGKPYEWGAVGPNRFDCSGFTQYVYKQFGIDITRTTYTQINQGTSVSRNDLQLGDLVFPHTGHVGIYVGNNQMIHAPQTGDVVKITNITKFYTARRIVDPYEKVHVGEYINVKSFMGTFPIFKDDKSFETWNRLTLLSAPISVKVLDNPSKNVYKVKETRYGNVGYVYVEENNNYTFTPTPVFEEVPLYKGISDGVQVTDLCSAKWIPGIVEEQLNKAVNKIVITNVNDTSEADYPLTGKVINETSEEVYAGEPLYKMLVDGKQVTDMCSRKWIPGFVEEQLTKKTLKIEIIRVQ